MARGVSCLDLATPWYAENIIMVAFLDSQNAEAKGLGVSLSLSNTPR